MDGGQSISFTSFDSYNYPTPNNLTFHEIEPASSQYELAKDSMIRHFPGKKVNLGQHLEVLVLLQTAEIERLTNNLHEYRIKYDYHHIGSNAFSTTKRTITRSSTRPTNCFRSRTSWNSRIRRFTNTLRARR